MLEMKLREHVNYASSQSSGVCSLSRLCECSANSDRANHRTFRYHTVFLRALFRSLSSIAVPRSSVFFTDRGQFLRDSGPYRQECRDQPETRDSWGMKL